MPLKFYRCAPQTCRAAFFLNSSILFLKIHPSFSRRTLLRTGRSPLLLFPGTKSVTKITFPSFPFLFRNAPPRVRKWDYSRLFSKYSTESPKRETKVCPNGVLELKDFAATGLTRIYEKNKKALPLSFPLFPGAGGRTVTTRTGQGETSGRS